MTRFFVGLDVSKGYVDCWVLGTEGQVGTLARYDESRNGHEQFWSQLDQLADNGVEIHVGMESTGGLERRWKTSVRQWRQQRCGPSTSIAEHVLDPRAVKQTAKSMGTRCKTDCSSAEAIARHLSNGWSSAPSVRSAQEEARTGLLRGLLSLEKQRTQTINMIKSVLPQANPAMVAPLSQSGLPAWGIDVLSRYPTAQHLARAKLPTLSGMKHVGTKKASGLIARASEVVGLDGTLAYEDQMLMLLENYKLQQKLIEKQWTLLLGGIADNPETARLLSIPGIGLKTSCGLIIELGSLTRFGSSDALVGFCGLDPTFEQSGDGVVQHGISHRGPAHLRALLFNAAKSAISCNPIIKIFYWRLRSRGKTYMQALTACMAKLLRIAFACVVTGKDFDFRVHQEHCKNAAAQDHRATQPLGRQETAEASTDTDAPVSCTERRRRRQEKQEKQQETSTAQGKRATKKPAAGRKPSPQKTKATGGRHHARS